MKALIGRWNKHKKKVITGAQVMAVITMIGGMIENHYSIGQNSTEISTQNQWMKDAIKLQTTDIVDLKIENAVLRTKYDDLKERVQMDEQLLRDEIKFDNF